MLLFLFHQANKIFKVQRQKPTKKDFRLPRRIQTTHLESEFLSFKSHIYFHTVGVALSVG